MGSGPRGLLFTGRPLSRPWRRGSVLATALEWKRPRMCLTRGSFPRSRVVLPRAGLSLRTAKTTRWTRSSIRRRCFVTVAAKRLVRGPLRVVLEGAVVFGGPAWWWGRLSGVIGLDVSKTEGIKASLAWVSPRDQAMTWRFRRVSSVLSVCFRCRAAWCPG